MAKKSGEAVYLADEIELNGLLARLSEVLQRESLPEDVLRMQRNKNTVSLYLRSDLICRLNIQKGRYSSLCLNRTMQTFAPAWAIPEKEEADPLCFDLDSFHRLSGWSDTLCAVCEKRIDEISKQFDCCDRYLQCSDAGQCTNPDRLYAMECGYKKILKKGQIFYGKKRNVKDSTALL